MGYPSDTPKYYTTKECEEGCHIRVSRVFLEHRGSTAKRKESWEYSRASDLAPEPSLGQGLIRASVPWLVFVQRLLDNEAAHESLHHLWSIHFPAPQACEGLMKTCHPTMEGQTCLTLGPEPPSTVYTIKSGAASALDVEPGHRAGSWLSY